MRNKNGRNFLFCAAAIFNSGSISTHFSMIFGPLYSAPTTDKPAGLSISSSHA
ncbi:hypothetical protein Hanom_Chr14g01308191 [Helianthus anomalus]